MDVNVIENAHIKLSEFWQDQKIVSPANSFDDILKFEATKNLQLPDDFKRLYMMSNGMVSLYPNDFDEEGYLFYPLQELITFEERFASFKSNSDDHYLIFAEYMHESWWYAVRFSKCGDNYEIGIVSSADKFKLITQNLGAFIHLYINDDPILYDYL